MYFINKNDNDTFNKIHNHLIISIIIVNKYFFFNNYYFKLQIYLKMIRLLQILVSLFFLLAPLATYGKAIKTTSFSSSSLNPDTATVNIIYKNGVLNIKGLTGTGNITIYSIIGNEIGSYYNVNLVNFQRSIVLDRKTMFIIRVKIAGEIKTYKLVTR